MTTTLASQIVSHLALKNLYPTQAWLNAFLATQKPTTPLPALKQTAMFRLLASDITTSLQSTPASVFPSDILNMEIKERTLTGPIPVMVLDVEDVGRSRWSQVEGIEAMERGEMTKGREVVRVVAGEEGLQGPGGGSGSDDGGGGPCKLLLCDAKGVRVFAFEVVGVEGLGLKMKIGAKMVLKGATVARGVVLLDPSCATILGGKVEELHKKWKEGRKARLITQIEAQEPA